MVKYPSQHLDRTFSALADPTRRRMLEHLALGDCCVTDLAKPHRMSLPAVSKHLKVLEGAGLVSRRKDGRVHSLKLEAAPMKQAQDWIGEYRRFWEAGFDRPEDYLKQLQTNEDKYDNEDPTQVP
jgi:DNA-binding transcriptional ArsR family regulator